MARKLDPIFQDLPPCMQRIGYWLLLLTQPGQSISFIPSQMGLTSGTVQNYVWVVGEVLGVRFRVIGGVARHPDGRRRNPPENTPLTVTRLKSCATK